jgi:hypothetical protein
MNQQQCITILGSTGSIGTSTLDVLSRHPDQYRIHALTASSQVELMLAQCARFKPEVAVMVQESAGRQLAERVKAEGLPVQVRWGTAALDEVACAPQVDAVMAAIVGAAGLSPCIAAARDVERADEAVGEDVRVRRCLGRLGRLGRLDRGHYTLDRLERSFFNLCGIRPSELGSSDGQIPDECGVLRVATSRCHTHLLDLSCAILVEDLAN